MSWTATTCATASVPTSRLRPADRAENIRRIGEVAGLFADAGLIVLSAFISPYRADREQARSAASDTFHEVYLETDVETCEKRDPKGLYVKARRGEIADFTGISAPYEVPQEPELVIDTATLDVPGKPGHSPRLRGAQLRHRRINEAPHRPSTRL